MTKERLQERLLKAYADAKQDKIELSDDLFNSILGSFWFEFEAGFKYAIRNQLDSFIVGWTGVMPVDIPFKYMVDVWNWAYEKLAAELSAVKVPFMEKSDLAYKSRKIFEFTIREMKQFMDPMATVGKPEHPEVHN